MRDGGKRGVGAAHLLVHHGAALRPHLRLAPHDELEVAADVAGVLRLAEALQERRRVDLPARVAGSAQAGIGQRI